MSDVLDILNLPLVTIGDQTITVAQLVLVPLLLGGGWILMSWGARAMNVRLKARNVSPDLLQFINRAFYVVAIAVLAVTALDLLNVPLTAFAFVSGAIAIGIGFGAQNIINNFISGWILMWERPIRIGDFLELEDTRGTVEAINTRSTRIRRVDGVHMLIPNSHLLENTVVNWTLVDQMTRASVRVGVAYGSPARMVSELILQAVREQDDALSDPEPTVIFEDFGDNALIFDAFFWINATAERDLRKIRSDVRYRIDELFNAQGIVIAFPQRDVHLDGVLRLDGARVDPDPEPAR